MSATPSHLVETPRPGPAPARESARADILAGLLPGLLAVVVTSSFAPLLFRGVLASYLPVGVGLALMATIVVAVQSRRPRRAARTPRA